MKRSGIFIKVFLYTIIFSALLVGATAALFSSQLMTYYSGLQLQKISSTYKQLIDRSHGDADITVIANQFHDRNQTFRFYITDERSTVVYVTPETHSSGSLAGKNAVGEKSAFIVYLGNGYVLHVFNDDVISLKYGNLIARVLVMLSAMLAVCVIGAFVFARQMTKPIKTLADNTAKMANLEEVPPLPDRNDELGLLARDVHSMYDRLKITISRLENEILRERELEETQRYFFSAASHELKTPVAATSVLLEGMLANIGDYKNHPKYLRECLKMMDAQSKMISDILEIVRLDDGKIVPVPEQLNVRQTVSGRLMDYHALSEARGQHIVTDIPDGQTCLADPNMLEKALSNILLNAVQNTPDGGEIRIYSDPALGHYRLCVLNKNVRIDDTVLPKLFEPFYREDKARSRKNERSGLGLAIVRKTLDAMNIDFALENTPEGVLFWMNLPAVTKDGIKEI
ncbi:HAMP domain-containing sensor histidine kinase [Paenibacillus sp. BK720]|uniref:HAMP domain-containing sensor histidine kinase n=1 Tax=Paenibacillus sp. BK720 TaxID=2587092 RepID=UPI00141F85B7|nr:HAMP domain-containing sensor histidine kinase [Paenibacillus sp. BK720]NIK71889.1 two-component system sensor histidine kinase VanS [Paenibacillus sp. BK720]